MASYTTTIAKFTASQRIIYISIIDTTLKKINKTYREMDYLWNYMSRREDQITALSENMATEISDEKLLEIVPMFRSIATLYPGESTELDEDNTAMFNILNRVINKGIFYSKEVIDISKNTEYIAGYLSELTDLKTKLAALRAALVLIK